MKKSKIFISAILCVVLAIPFIKPKTIIKASDTSSVHSFYHNPLNIHPEDSTIDKGLEYFARLSAVNTHTNQVEYSSKNWDTSSSYNIYSLVQNSADVFDMTNSTNLSLIGELKNVAGADVTVSLSFELPNKTILTADNARITNNPVTGNYGSNLSIKYNYNGTNYSYDELQTLNDFSWENVRVISFTGKLGANETAKLNLPLKLQSENTQSLDIRIRSYSPSRKSTWVRARASKYLYTVDDLMSGVYMGAYRETINGVDTYKKVPNTIQAKLPEVKKSDFVYSMFNSLYQAGTQADLTQHSDGVAYDHSQYLISTERIFNAIKDDGYSVYRDDVRGLWNSYAYYMGNNLKFTDEDGNDVVGGVFDSKANVLLSKYYVELHKVFDTRDIVMYVGDSWNKFDNLTYRQSIATRGSSSHQLTDDEITVTNNVNTQVPGVYWVKYSHQVDTDKFVTKTAKVTVIGKYNVNYSFESSSLEKSLPNEVTQLLPSDTNEYKTNDVVNAQPATFENGKVTDGTWVFKGWKESSITVQNSDIQFVGVWEFVADKEKPQPKPEPNPEPQPEPEKPTNPIKPQPDKTTKLQPKNSPDTSDVNNLLIHISGIIISLMIIRFINNKSK